MKTVKEIRPCPGRQCPLLRHWSKSD